MEKGVRWKVRSAVLLPNLTNVEFPSSCPACSYSWRGHRLGTRCPECSLQVCPRAPVFRYREWLDCAVKSVLLLPVVAILGAWWLSTARPSVLAMVACASGALVWFVMRAACCRDRIVVITPSGFSVIRNGRITQTIPWHDIGLLELSHWHRGAVRVLPYRGCRRSEVRRMYFVSHELAKRFVSFTKTYSRHGPSN